MNWWDLFPNMQETEEVINDKKAFMNISSSTTLGSMNQKYSEILSGERQLGQSF